MIELTGKEVSLLIPARIRYEQAQVEFATSEKIWNDVLSKVLEAHGCDSKTHGVDLQNAVIREIDKPVTSLESGNKLE